MPSKKHRVEHQVSAGGVLCRQANGNRDVLLCGRRTPKLWALPKGGPDVGETLEETALREVQEETGLVAEIKYYLGKIQYTYTRSQDKTLCFKTVHFYLMSPIGGDILLHDPEFDYVRWFHEDEALGVMNYETEQGLVRKALALARTGD